MFTQLKKPLYLSLSLQLLRHTAYFNSASVFLKYGCSLFASLEVGTHTDVNICEQFHDL